MEGECLGRIARGKRQRQADRQTGNGMRERDR